MIHGAESFVKEKVVVAELYVHRFITMYRFL
jgi:hypothetical protein